ncbi:MAG: hypothetical protein RLN81_02970 [Balneolaceae bacterium]
MTDTLANYLEIYKKLSERESSEIFSHKGNMQSAHIMGLIFRSSVSHVRMYVGDFNGDVSNNQFYIEELKDFIDRGGTLDVLIEEDNLIKSDAFTFIQAYSGFRETVSIKQADINKRITFGEEEKPIHFTVGDLDKFRLELDIENYSGIASFNNQEFAHKLANAFDSLFIDESLRVLSYNR